MVPPHLADELRILLENFLSEQPGSDDVLRRFLSPLVWKYCSRHAPTMPLDLREDILQETFLLLAGSGQGSYDGGRDTGAGYVYNTVRTALQAVRRRYGWTMSQRPATEATADLDALPGNVEVERLEHVRILAHEVLASVEPAFGAILWKVYVEGQRQEVALADAGISRSTFDRRRRAIAQSLSTLGRCA
jgi:DNA-directed RNA polymerase specialized sigma24 family protein